MRRTRLDWMVFFSFLFCRHRRLFSSQRSVDYYYFFMKTSWTLHLVTFLQHTTTCILNDPEIFYFFFKNKIKKYYNGFDERSITSISCMKCRNFYFYFVNIFRMISLLEKWTIEIIGMSNRWCSHVITRINKEPVANYGIWIT